MTYKILALDVASKTGYCSWLSSGVWDFRPKRDESKGYRLIKFKTALKKLHSEDSIDIIVYERVAGRFQAATNVASEFIGVLKTFCEENSIEYRAYSAKEIKKFATGKGSANKQKMVDSAIEKYGVDVIDDNHADALHLYHLVRQDLLLND